MNKTILRNYAKLLACAGLNIRRGDEVIINAELDQPEFVEMVVRECYRAGAAKVNVEWSHQPLQKIHVNCRSLKVLSRVEEWEKAKLQHRVDKLPAMLYLVSEDPDGLAGMNQAKNSKAMQARYGIIKPFRDAMDNKYKWCIAAVPGKAWAKKMFPGLRASAAIEKQWEAILYTVRMTKTLGGEPQDGLAAWAEHNAQFHKRCDYLNSLGIETLEYHSANGTNLTVGMMENGMFCGGSEKTLGGEEFNPNMPTEELFVTPKRGVAEGIVYSSKPLSYRGQIIDNFWIRFHEGKAVEAHAEQNDELLQQMITMDEGAAYLGECALVPFHSPISQSGLTFFETLFDENAACHLAMGAGFTNAVKDYDKYTLEQLHEMGVNDSMIHVDFMIGTEDLSVVAHTRDGKSVPLFENGDWAF
jgi:aminopeptidase